MTNSRTRTMAMIPNMYTERGVPPESSLVSRLESG